MTDAQFLIRCAVSGQFLSDVTALMEVIAVTLKPEHGMIFGHASDAELVSEEMRKGYPSFDWAVVHREDYTVKPARPVFIGMQGKSVQVKS